MPSTHLVCLGSSFAAGPSIPPITSRAALRSSNNYASILTRRLPNAHLTDLSVSAATLSNVLSTPQSARFPPQLSLLPPDADIVLLTAGGNDLKYVGAMIRDCLEMSWAGWMLAKVLPIGIPDAEPLSEERLAARFVAVVDKILAIAPKARVLLVEYLTVLGPDVRPGIDVPFGAERVRHHQSVAEKLHHAHELAAEQRREKCELVPIAELSRLHGLGSAEPWVEGFSYSKLAGAGILHPNLAGMTAIANILFDFLHDGEYKGPRGDGTARSDDYNAAVRKLDMS